MAKFSTLSLLKIVLSQSRKPLFQGAIALLSGLGMALATEPLHLWGIAWIALAPLWVMVAEQRAVGLAFYRLPLLWGLGYYGLTLSWITGLHPLTWLGVPWLASIAIALFCWIFITLWGTVPVLLWAWGMRWFWRKRTAAHSRPDLPTQPPGKALFFSGVSVWVGTALWCGLEWLRNLTPLDWASLSFTQSSRNLVILHLGQLSGPLLVTAAIVAVNGLIAEAWMSRSGRSPIRDRDDYRAKSSIPIPHPSTVNSPQSVALIAIALMLFCTLHLIGFALYRQPLNDSPTAALTIGMIQGNVPTRIKLSAEGIRKAVDGYVAGYETLAAQSVDAVLTPEGAFPFYWNPTRNPLYQAVVEKNVPLWLGTFVKTDRTITQSLLSLAADGSVVGRYNKIKLVPLGEYIPFPEILGNLINRLSPIEARMQPGAADQEFNTPFGRAIASICYDSAFPYLFRDQAAGGGEFILTASNLDPYSEVLMAQHQAHDLMRAIESDRWIVRVTNTGYSSVIDPHGHRVWRSQPNTYQTHVATIARRSSQTLYVRWGDWFTPLLLGSAMLLYARSFFKPVSHNL
jgi:apolipoprotein N-acyltransferase